MLNPFQSKSDVLFEWVDLVNPTEAQLAQLGQQYPIHASAIQDLKQPDHLPKYEALEDLHFVICRFYDETCAKTADSIPEMTNRLAIFYRKGLLITIHTHAHELINTVVEKYRNHPNVQDVVCKLIKTSLSTFEKPIDKLDAEIDFYEARIFLKKRIPDLLKSLYQIKHKAYILRKLVNLTKDIVERVTENSGKRNPIMQDLKDHYINIDTQVEEVYDDIVSLMNIYISLSSQRTNEVMRTLTVFTAFFLPLTFIVGIYGMNFRYMPELDEQWGYPGVLGLMLFITLAVWLWFKRKGWM